MNLVLLEPEDLIAENRARLTGRRAEHLRGVHRAEPGRELRVGMLGGLVGSGRVEAVTDEAVELTFALDQPPPPRPGIDLILGLPRPRVLRRVLRSVAAQGVDRVVLVNSWRVDKSYWQSPVLQPDAIRADLILGLEQARDTALPTVTLEPLFKPFVEDRLPALVEGRRALVAHPVADGPLTATTGELTTLCVGPEGGWIQYEVDKLAEAGCELVSLGERILVVEDALTSCLARLGAS